MTYTPDQFKNSAVSRLIGGGGGGNTPLLVTDTSLTIIGGDGAQFSSASPFMLALGNLQGNYELLKCTNRSGDTFTVLRGQEGTIAQQWPVTTLVTQVITAGSFNDIWAAVNSGREYFVDDYGSVGGTSDDIAINAAIAAAAANGGGIVKFGPHLYKTSAALIINADNIILRGSGWQTIIQPVSGAQFDVIATPIPPSVGASGFVRNYIGIEHLMLDCSLMNGVLAGQGNGIHFYGVRYSVINRVYVKSCDNYAILLDGDNTGPGQNFGYDNIVRDCIFDLCNGNIWQTNCEANDFINNRFKWAGATTLAPQPVFGTQDTQGYHLRLGSGYAYVAGNILGKGGNYTTPAIRTENSGPCRIIGNRFDQPRNQAVVLNGGNHEFAFNAVGSPGSAGTGVPAIQLGSSNNRVIGNSFDITAGAMSATYAIQENGGPFSNNIFANNHLLPGTSGLLNLKAGSSDRVSTNSGLTPYDGYNVREFGARADGVTDDTLAIQAALNAANLDGGGTVRLTAGTFLTGPLTTYSKVYLRGAGAALTNLLLAPGSNGDLISGGAANVALINVTNTVGGNGSTGGLFDWGLSDLTLDGNKVNQSGTSYGIRVYGFGERLRDINVLNARSGGILLDWNGGSTPVGEVSGEPYLFGVKVRDCGGVGLTIGGGTDAMITQCIIERSGSHNVYIGPHGTAPVFTSCHFWGSALGNNSVSVLVEGEQSHFTACEAEGSDGPQVVFLTRRNSWVGGSIFGLSTVGSSSSGLQIGQTAGLTPYAGSVNQTNGVTLAVAAKDYLIDTHFFNCYGANGALWFLNDAGGNVRANIQTNSNTGSWGSGTVSVDTRLDYSVYDLTGSNNRHLNQFNGYFALSQQPNVSVQTISSGAAIQPSGFGIVLITNATNATTVTIPAGLYPGQMMYVVNRATSASFTFDAVATSHVADGAADVLAPGTARGYIWVNGPNLWYPIR